MRRRLFKEKVVTLRKPAKCWGCGREFKKGERIMKVASVKDRHFSHTSWCEVCLEYGDAFLESGDDVNFGSFRDNDPEKWEGIRAEVEIP